MCVITLSASTFLLIGEMSLTPKLFSAFNKKSIGLLLNPRPPPPTTAKSNFNTSPRIPHPPAEEEPSLLLRFSRPGSLSPAPPPCPPSAIPTTPLRQRRRSPNCATRKKTKIPGQTASRNSSSSRRRLSPRSTATRTKRRRMVRRPRWRRIQPLRSGRRRCTPS